MWIVVNGAPKTGSVWLVDLMRATGITIDVPDELQNPKWVNSSVDPASVKKASGFLPAAEPTYLSKQHWKNEHADLLKIDGVYIINSIRDIRDVVVSHYHHQVRIGKENRSISDYIADNARGLVRYFCAYHEYWIDAARGISSRYHITSYEYLHDDDITAAGKLYDFVDITVEGMNTTVASVRFEKQNTGHGKHLRKGSIQAFLDDISEAEAEKILKWATKYGLLRIKQKIASFHPAIRPYLYQTDVGL